MTQAKQQLQEAKREKGAAEQQASALTGSLGYDSAAEAERENKSECDICMVDGGEHES